MNFPDQDFIRLCKINPWLQTSVEDLLRMFGKPGALLKYRRMQEILNDPDWVSWLEKSGNCDVEDLELSSDPNFIEFMRRV